MSEYQIKLEAIGEYKEAIRYKMMNEDLCSSLVALLGQLSSHYEKIGMKIPEEVSRIMEKASRAVDARINYSRHEPPVRQTG